MFILLHERPIQGIFGDSPDSSPVEMGFDLDNALLFLVGCRVSKDEVHVFESLRCFGQHIPMISGYNSRVKKKKKRQGRWVGIYTFPRVSGIQKKVNTNAIRLNAAKKIYVPQVIDSSMSGVMRPMILNEGCSCQRGIWEVGEEMIDTYKLHIQVADVVIEMALERMDKLKISEGRTHPIGAIVTS